jgi:hypothetical protein
MCPPICVVMGEFPTSYSYEAISIHIRRNSAAYDVWKSHLNPNRAFNGVAVACVRGDPRSSHHDRGVQRPTTEWSSRLLCGGAAHSAALPRNIDKIALHFRIRNVSQVRSSSAPKGRRPPHHRSTRALPVGPRRQRSHEILLPTSGIGSDKRFMVKLATV